MKSITRLAFGAAVAAGLVLAPEAGAQGQQQGRGRAERGQRMDPAQRIERRVGMLTERLQLSQTQSTQIRQILTQESEQMRAIFEKQDAGADRESLRPQRQSLRQDTDNKIAAVLTEQQRKTYSELREEMRERGQRGKGARGERPPRNG
jgi:Spy/CpxP family protein refolding chaperone